MWLMTTKEVFTCLAQLVERLKLKKKKKKKQDIQKIEKPHV